MNWIKEEKLYPLIALILIMIMAVRMPLDTDMWWHLRAGEQTLANKAAYAVDTFSFTRNGADWTNHSWLSQVLMYSLFQLGSYKALSIWVGLCAVISMGLIYLQMKGHPLWRASILIFAATVSSVVWSPRPQILSLVLFSLLSYSLYLYKGKGNNKILLGIPPLFLLWGNLHGGYILGILLIMSVIAGEILNHLLLNENPARLSWRQISYLFAAMLLGFAAVLINPFGIDMWMIPFNTVGVETLQNVISEWASPDFHQSFQQPMLLMLLGIMGILGISKKQIDGSELVPLILFSWAALTARRNFGPFAIIAAPIMSNHLTAVIEDIKNTLLNKYSNLKSLQESIVVNNQDFNPRLKNILNAIIICLLFGAAIWKIYEVNQPELIAKTEREIFPVGAVQWLKDNEPRGNLFNEYNWGGYLIWHNRETPVFVDGRTDLFGDEILQDYLDVLSAQDDWMNILDKYQIDVLLIRNDSALVQIAQMNEWQIKFSDSKATILIR